MTPSDLKEQFLMLNTGYKLNKPCVVRYERTSDNSSVSGLSLDDTIEIGKGRLLLEGKKIAICAFGSIAKRVYPVAQKYNLTLADMRFVKPLDVELVKQLASTHDAIITLEEGVVHGGIGQEILAVVQKFNETLDSSKTKSDVIVKGFADHFILEGTRDELLHDETLDNESIEKLVQTILKDELYSKRIVHKE